MAVVPSYPMLQEHANDPALSEHAAFLSQVCVPTSHSSMLVHE